MKTPPYPSLRTGRKVKALRYSPWFAQRLYRYREGAGGSGPCAQPCGHLQRRLRACREDEERRLLELDDRIASARLDDPFAHELVTRLHPEPARIAAPAPLLLR